jgi:hypothetical protein
VSLHTRTGLNVLMCFRDSNTKQNGSYLLSNETSNVLRRVIYSGKLLLVVSLMSINVSDEISASIYRVEEAFALNSLHETLLC